MKRVMTATWALVAAALVWTFTPPVQNAHAASPGTPWQKLTPAQLSAVWWQWALSIQVTDSPLFDDTGVNAFSGQPYSDLLFLGGTSTQSQLQNGDVLGEATRSICVRQGTAFFFPVVNSESDNTGFRPNLGGNFLELDPFPQVMSIPELRALAASSVEIATGVYATLKPTDAKFKTATGPTQTLNHPRLQSPPFPYRLPATDNIGQHFGIDVSGTVAPSVADGYYTFIPGSLAPGYYVLQFGGVLPVNDAGNTLTLAITYNITVSR